MKLEKVLLVAPDPGKFATERHLLRIAKPLSPPLGLLATAALTPENIELKLIDEAVTHLDFSENADLVALTANTTSIMRAYEIAAEFRRRGKKVILGGIHASAEPQEALQYVDSVIIGEGEFLWPEILADVSNHKLKNSYESEDFPSIEKLPWPRRELVLPKSYYLPNTIQTSRGCPKRCHFCCVPKFFGGTYRMRNIDDCVQEIIWLKNWSPKSPFIFVDDNIFGNPKNSERAKALMEAMIPLNIEWFGQASMDNLLDDAFLALASKSGCRMIFVGFESLSKDNLKTVNKHWNDPLEMKSTVERLDRYKIAILGAFIVGLENDGLNVVEEIVNYVQIAKIPLVQITILIPLPGTKTAKDLKDVIFDPDYRKRDGNSMVFYHQNIYPPRYLEERLQKANVKIYSKEAVNDRLKGKSGRHIDLARIAIRGYQLRMNKWIQKLAQKGLKI